MVTPEQIEVIQAYREFSRRLGCGYQRALFSKMVERSDRDPAYGRLLLRWLRQGSTHRLRELAEPFGAYFGNLDFANVVDGLDSEIAHGRVAESTPA